MRVTRLKRKPDEMTKRLFLVPGKRKKRLKHEIAELKRRKTSANIKSYEK
jgi:hypothetical protein